MMSALGEGGAYQKGSRSTGGCVSCRSVPNADRGGGVKNLTIFADVICTCPLTILYSGQADQNYLIARLFEASITCMTADRPHRKKAPISISSRDNSVSCGGGVRNSQSECRLIFAIRDHRYMKSALFWIFEPLPTFGTDLQYRDSKSRKGKIGCFSTLLQYSTTWIVRARIVRFIGQNIIFCWNTLHILLQKSITYYVK